jgi:membrane-bound lytic murein transglycosylase D
MRMLGKTQWLGRMALLMGIVLLFFACASPQEQVRQLRVGAQDSSQALVPQDFFIPEADPQRGVDPQLAREIQAFIAESGILQGAPDEAQGQFSMVMNQPVKTYLKYFSGTGKANFRASLARSRRYLPMMRRILQEHGLPPELVYLALIESGYNPWARSPAEAVGPWQFIEGTARRYGLKVNGQVDERRDPEKSTRAAARYLKDLYRQFGCWYLALAGYNAGEKRVEGAMRFDVKQDFWTLAQHRRLPQETCNFVPQFIAAALIARNPENFGFSKLNYHKPLIFHTVKVPGGTDLRRFAEELQVSLEEIRGLNPELNQWVAPRAQREYLFKVPLHKKKEARRLAQVCWQRAQKPGRLSAKFSSRQNQPQP